VDDLLVEPVRLADGRVGVWAACLNQAACELERLWPLLSVDEKARAGRFHFEKDRRAYIIGRGTLRRLLGGYLELDPSQVQFEYAANGKPGLKPGLDGLDLQFNLSHAGDLVLFAFCRRRRVGLDVEFLRPLQYEDHFAGQLFSRRESAVLRALSGSEKTRAFYQFWTAKEAYLKACGDGLTRPVDEVEIELCEGKQPRLAAIGGWRLEAFQPAEGYLATLALEEEQPIGVNLAGG
jgi:4'-phosphopantetheinyl transferase